MSQKRTVSRGALIAGAALVLLIALFVWRSAVTGRLADLAEFLVDRREGAGQTQPDRGAVCLYDLIHADDGSDQLRVDRKAHGQWAELSFDLTDDLVEPHFAGQQALIETATSADTFNCITAEFESHELDADTGNPIARVLFSETGRNLALIQNKEEQEARVEVFSFSATPGKSQWNRDIDPLSGPVLYRKIAGESLIIVLESESGPIVHTYNYRASHKNQPWNEFDPESRPFVPPGTLTAEPRFEDRGKSVVFEATTAEGQSLTYSFDFTCRQRVEGEAAEDQPPNDKPCTWSVVH